MNRGRNLLFLALCPVLLPVLPCAGPGVDSNTLPAKSTEYKIEKRKLERGRHGRVTMEIPILKYPAHRDFQKRVNANLSNMLLKEAAVFEKMYQAYPEDAAVSRKHLQLNWTFLPVHVGKRILSLRLFRYEYSGGAHGSHLVVTRNYDLKAGREIKLADLFRPGTPWLKRLSTLSREYLGGRLSWADGIAPKEKNFEAFLIKPEGLGLIFQTYQIAPYAAGIAEITIPWRELRSVLRTPAVELTGTK